MFEGQPVSDNTSFRGPRSSSNPYAAAPSLDPTAKKRRSSSAGLKDPKASEEEEKKRHERNMREQQRSQKTGQQIKELRGILAESNIPFKPTKFSILASIVEHIKQLQSHEMFLDAEHRKLINTINQTSEMMQSGQTPASEQQAPKVPAVGNDADMLFVQDIDHKNIFQQCSAALGVGALDGRFIDCNHEFEIVSGYSKADLMQLSLFNLLTNSDMEEVFQVMGSMLKEKASSEGSAEDTSVTTFPPESYWSGVVVTPHKSVEDKIVMNITLARSSDGTPKFFNCALIPA